VPGRRLNLPGKPEGPRYPRLVVQRFCTKCGGPIEAGDRFCGECGQAVRGAPAGPTDPHEPTMDADVLAEDEAEQENLLADWDFGLDEEVPPPPPVDPPAVAPDQAPTQSIAVGPQPRDTAVLPVQPEQAPYEPERYEPTPGPAAAPVPAPVPMEHRRGFPVGATLALFGGVAVIMSSVLDWGRGELAGTLPREISARQLISPDAEAAGMTMGIALLIAGTVGALVALLTMAVPALQILRRLIGLATLVVPVLFVIRVAVPLFADLRFGDVLGVLGVGFYFATVGALVQMIAGRLFSR
jgi:hypothetical protein